MVRFFARRYPSANGVLLTGAEPVLVDTGFGTDFAELATWLDAQGCPADKLALVVNTHFHTDHAGANHLLQATYGTPIAAEAGEAALVDEWGPAACERGWLAQPVERYTVGTRLQDGDEIVAGWVVLATPGHTDGHLSLFHAQSGTLVLGDALHNADIGWLSPLRPHAIEQTQATIERLAALPARVGYSGHGPVVNDIPAALGRARRRLQNWGRDPQMVGWHACKRVFAHALMLQDGLNEADLTPALLAWPWFRDHARLTFATSPETFAPLLIDEMVRSDAAFWRDGTLVARAEYNSPTRRHRV